MGDFRFLLATPEQGYRGTKASFWFLIGLMALTSARSLIHIFAADGGAELIAGLSIEGEVGENLVHIFSQWGLQQLIMAIFGWVSLPATASLSRSCLSCSSSTGPCSGYWASSSRSSSTTLCGRDRQVHFRTSLCHRPVVLTPQDS